MTDEELRQLAGAWANSTLSPTAQREGAAVLALLDRAVAAEARAERAEEAAASQAARADNILAGFREEARRLETLIASERIRAERAERLANLMGKACEEVGKRCERAEAIVTAVRALPRREVWSASGIFPSEKYVFVLASDLDAALATDTTPTKEKE